MILRRILRHISRRVNSRNAETNPSPPVNLFSTHLPILIGVAQIFKCRRVLELGGGQFSSPIFLDQRIFPFVENVLTLENDHHWAREVAVFVGNDPRHKLQVVDGNMSHAVAKCSLSWFDLVFIDDSKTIGERVETLKETANGVSPHALVVMHDFEAPEYQLAATGFRNRLLVSGYYPATGILWNDAVLRPRDLEALCTIVRLSAARVPPDDIPAWIASFSALSCN